MLWNAYQNGPQFPWTRCLSQNYLEESHQFSLIILGLLLFVLNKYTILFTRTMINNQTSFNISFEHEHILVIYEPKPHSFLSNPRMTYSPLCLITLQLVPLSFPLK